MERGDFGAVFWYFGHEMMQPQLARCHGQGIEQLRPHFDDPIACRQSAQARCK